MNRLLLLALVSFVALACDQRQAKAACWSAIQEARDAVVADDLDGATERLNQAREVCDGRSPDELRRVKELIADRRDAKRAAQQAEAARGAQDSPVRRFVAWATREHENVARDFTKVRCAPRGAPEYGFCSGEWKQSPAATVRYYDKSPAAIRYTFSTDYPLSCEDLGEHRFVRSWVSGEAKHTLCEITQREARNLSALVVNSPGQGKMLIYSVEYLEKDEEFERSLRGR